MAGPAGTQECSESVFYTVGYEVKGRVSAGGTGLSEVKIAVKPEDPAFCKTHLCVVTTDKAGTFKLVNVPEGRYTLVPDAGDKNYAFEPASLKAAVSSSILTLDTPFNLQTYDIKGTLDTKMEGAY